MIDAGLNELKHSFSEHSRAAQTGSSSSHFLLLFYAVECGLKACILKFYRKIKISQIKNQDITTHDLAFLVQELKWRMKDITFRLESGSARSIGDAHQAWRYGISIDGDDEKKVIEWLKQVQKKIKEEI